MRTEYIGHEVMEGIVGDLPDLDVPYHVTRQPLRCEFNCQIYKVMFSLVILALSEPLLLIVN